MKAKINIWDLIKCKRKSPTLIDDCHDHVRVPIADITFTVHLKNGATYRGIKQVKPWFHDVRFMVVFTESNAGFITHKDEISKIEFVTKKPTKDYCE